MRKNKKNINIKLYIAYANCNGKMYGMHIKIYRKKKRKKEKEEKEEK